MFNRFLHITWRFFVYSTPAFIHFQDLQFIDQNPAAINGKTGKSLSSTASSSGILSSWHPVAKTWYSCLVRALRLETIWNPYCCERPLPNVPNVSLITVLFGILLQNYPKWTTVPWCPSSSSPWHLSLVMAATFRHCLSSLPVGLTWIWNRSKTITRSTAPSPLSQLASALRAFAAQIMLQVL